VLLDVEGHGREDAGREDAGREDAAGEDAGGAVDLSRTVGWFTTLYPVLLEHAGEGPGDSLMRVKEWLRRVPRQGLGYGVPSPERAGEGSRGSPRPT
jgi:hypothetical protein